MYYIVLHRFAAKRLLGFRELADACWYQPPAGMHYRKVTTDMLVSRGCDLGRAAGIVSLYQQHRGYDSVSVVQREQTLQGTQREQLKEEVDRLRLELLTRLLELERY